MKDADLLKWQRMEEAIKDRIIASQWTLGQQLPSYTQLGKLFGVSQITVKQVVANLKQQNYLTGRERQGVFVAKDPPFRSRVGLVMANELGHVRFWRELAHSLRLSAARHGCELLIYENLQDHHETRQRLLRDIDLRVLGGVYITFREATVDELLPELRQSRPVPKFTFQPFEQPLDNQVVLELDSRSLARRGVEYLQRRGCRRIAYFGNYGAARILARYQEAIAESGLESPEDWQLCFMNEIKEMAAKTAGILLRLPAKTRPQAFFVGDDNLTLPVLQGVLKSGVRVPDDLAILSHCNWPEPQSNLLPVRYLGYPLADLAEYSLEALQRHYDDGSVPVSRKFGALFEEELGSPAAVPTTRKHRSATLAPPEVVS